jgi:hypothetical protein
MKYDTIVSMVLLLGLIDQVDKGYVTAEVTSADSDPIMMEFPLVMFPCEIEEGDYFYVASRDGVTEIRCGEPPD